MNNIQLSIGITSNPRTWPIIDGAVKVDGVDLIPTVLHPSELFWRQLRFAERLARVMPIYALDYRRDYELLQQVARELRQTAGG